ncbi:MAG: AAA family ATPase [Armatimonadetes bacterium]|nr:AAA family ATPase [Armatimonadota bacterium]
MHGEGGVKGLSEPEKTLARANALKTLGASKFPQISFRADRIEKVSEQTVYSHATGAETKYVKVELSHRNKPRSFDDILAGKAKILESISELDKLTSGRFLSTFAALQVAFDEMFKKMFGGGEGEIKLMDHTNVLDAGVEISVTVPGKKRQRLELLSGGERCLSATAFLFALLKVKPSPLVILDEVDAPLDGTNVERFVRVVREFCEHSQFMLITHNQVTIEEADAWFGVTMQEPGVSTVVPLKLPRSGLIEHKHLEPGKNGAGETPADKAYAEV